MLARLGMHVPPSDVVAALASSGIEVSETLVKKVQVDLLRKQARVENQRSKPLLQDKRRIRPQQRKIPPRPR
jgi:hypothetical protein